MFRPLGQPRTPLFRPPDTPNRPHRGGPEQDDPDASYPGEAFIEGDDDDEWEMWCEKHLEPLVDTTGESE